MLVIWQLSGQNLSDFVAESGHWYDKDGRPAYTQIVATGKNKGGERPTTVRDARKLSLLPSVTTISSILDKPALTHWKVMRALALLKWDIYTWMKEKGMPANISAAFKIMFKVKQPDMENKAQRGSEIHGALEAWLHDEVYASEFDPYIAILDDVLCDLGIDYKQVDAERSFGSELGYGGAVDLSYNVGDGVIIDFKTKDMDHEKCEKLKAYDEHIMQLAAYRMGLGLPKAKLYNLFLSRDNPSVYKLVEWTEEEAQWGEQAFMAVFSAWKLIKRYIPSGS